MKVREAILVCAFRYALGRATYVVGDVVMAITENWDELSINSKKLIRKEIASAILDNRAGHDCDAREWNRILELELYS